MSEFVVLIRYHGWWPGSSDPFYLYNVSENRARITYMGIDYAPHFWIDGSVDGEANRFAWESMLLNEYDNWSPLAMNITGSYDPDTRSGDFNVHIFAEMDPGASNTKLRIALVENDIIWHAPNNATLHDQTFRDMIPNAQGYGISMNQGDELDYSNTFTAPSPLIPENCMLVAFVQSDLNKNILQAARITIPELMETGVDEPVEMPRIYTLSQNYPNPFNATTLIDYNTAGGAVRIEVYDLTGSRVKTLVNQSVDAGHHSVVWNGLDDNGNDVASGVYFYKMTSPEGQQTRRMTLLK